MNKNNYGIIMAGGVGTRFWPLSTSKKPKQFHDILGVGRTFIQQTFDRLTKIIPTENIYIITLDEYTKITQEQLPEIKSNQIIAEPKGMNTAACNLYAALKIKEINTHANLVVAPSDHVILDEITFIEKISLALEKAENSKDLITLGIKPTRPDTGYGYIQFIENNKSLKPVKTFTEKPSQELAESFIKSGEFLWNAGIFIWSANSIINSFKEFQPEIYQTFTQIKHSINSIEGENEIRQVYATVKFISIDKGILEKSDHVVVIPSSFGWSDLGTWKSFYENSPHDKQGNTINGKPTILYNTQNSIIYSSNQKAIIVDGLNDYIVVDTPKALLICPKEKDQEIKAFVSDLKVNKGEKFA